MIQFKDKIFSLNIEKLLITSCALTVSIWIVSLISAYKLPLSSLSSLITFLIFLLFTFFNKTLVLTTLKSQAQNICTLISFYILFLIVVVSSNHISQAVISVTYRSFSQLLVIIPLTFLINFKSKELTNSINKLLFYITTPILIYAVTKHYLSFTHVSLAPQRSISLVNDYNFFSLGLWIYFLAGLSYLENIQNIFLKYFVLFLFKASLYTCFFFTMSRRSFIILLTFILIDLIRSISKEYKKSALTKIAPVIAFIYLINIPIFFNNNFSHKHKIMILNELSIKSSHIKNNFYYPYFRMLTLWDNQFNLNEIRETYIKDMSTRKGIQLMNKYFYDFDLKEKLFFEDNIDSTKISFFDLDRKKSMQFSPGDGQRGKRLLYAIELLKNRSISQLLLGDHFSYHNSFGQKFNPKKKFKGKYHGKPHIFLVSTILYSGLIGTILFLYIFLKSIFNSMAIARSNLTSTSVYMYMITLFYCSISSDIPQDIYVLMFFIIFFFMTPRKLKQTHKPVSSV